MKTHKKTLSYVGSLYSNARTTKMNRHREKYAPQSKFHYLFARFLHNKGMIGRIPDSVSLIHQSKQRIIYRRHPWKTKQRNITLQCDTFSWYNTVLPRNGTSFWQSILIFFATHFPSFASTMAEQCAVSDQYCDNTKCINGTIVNSGLQLWVERPQVLKSGCLRRTTLSDTVKVPLQAVALALLDSAIYVWSAGRIMKLDLHQLAVRE